MVGYAVGVFEGCRDGIVVGLYVGELDGNAVGGSVGVALGEGVTMRRFVGCRVEVGE